MNVYPSKLDWWIRLVLFVPALGAIGPSLYWALVHHDRTTLLIAIAILVGYGMILVGLVFPMRYTLAADGLEVRSGLVRQHFAWTSIISMKLSKNPLSSPALSLERIAIRYLRANGRERTILISPPDRDAFMAECARVSGLHAMRDHQLSRN